MKIWENTVPGRFPLRLNATVRVKFRDGSEGRTEGGTVSDYHGCGGHMSNWYQAGEPEDIVAYEEIVA